MLIAPRPRQRQLQVLVDADGGRVRRQRDRRRLLEAHGVGEVDDGVGRAHGVLGVGAARRVHDVEACDAVAGVEGVDGRADGGDDAADVVALVDADVEAGRVFVVFGVGAGADDFDEDFVGAVFAIGCC